MYDMKSLCTFYQTNTGGAFDVFFSSVTLYFFLAHFNRNSLFGKVNHFFYSESTAK